MTSYKRPHISYSEIAYWHQCSFRHKLKYVDGIDEGKPAVHFVFGHAIHAGCEHFLKTKELNIEHAICEFEKEWEKFKEDETFTEKSKLAHIELIKLILPEVPPFLDTNFPEWQFISAEEELYESIKETTEVKFKGFVDAVIACKNKKGDDVIWIIDFKTTAWGWKLEKKTDLMTKSQLVYYKEFWHKKYGVEPDNIKCGFILLKKTAKPGTRCEFIPVSIGDVTKKRSLDILDNMLYNLDRGRCVKNRLACDYCEFHMTDHCKLI